MRVAAILHPYEKDHLLEPFRLAGVNVFRGNSLEPGDLPQAAIVFGGDGSVHRVIQALAGSECPLLVVPTGSGNDFATSIGIRSVNDALIAWKSFVGGAGHVRTIDLGMITPMTERPPLQDEHAVPVEARTFIREDGTFEKPSQKLAPAIMRQHLHFLYDQVSSERYFCCVAGCGLDAETNRRANKFPSWFRRFGGYVLSAIGSVLSYRPQIMTVSVADDSGGFRSRISEPALLTAIGNAPSYGRGMRITTKAAMDDGSLDVCFVRKAGKLRVLRLFHTVFGGDHLVLPEVEYFAAKHLWLETESPLAIYADGEYICDTPAEIRVRP
ncbi:MAG TPA: diacylglycerol kinase family protein, partial [Terriglobales bacterium]